MFSEVKTSATNEQKGKGAIIQPKLKVNVPGDSYEREADAMAEKIVQNPIHQLGMSGTPFTSVSSNYIQRKCDKCKEDETKKRNGILMRKADNSGGLQPSSGFESTLSASKGAGSPLPAHAKTYMESAFSADFSKVRVHTGSAAIEMNKDVNAKAFTHGSDIYFNNGQYNTDTNTGTKLLVHELTHVVQQNNNTELNRSIQRQPDKPLPDDPPKSMYSAQYIVSSYYPLLLPLLNINQMSLIQAHLDYRYNIKKHNKDEDAMKARFQKRMKKLGLKYVEDPNPRFDTPGGYYSEEQNYAVSTYFRRIEEFEERSPDFPSDTDIYVDTTPLIDEKILDQQPWNIQAEQEFRERWVANLTGKQCMYRIALDGLSIDQILRGPVWEERWLQTENGLITFNSLFNIPEARQDYYYSVQNSPLITSVRENMRQIKSLYSNTENMYDLEVARKKEFPGVSRVAEFLGSELDGEALKQFIPKGKNIDNISFVEMLVVIRTLTKEQMDLVTRTLPSRAKWDEAVGFYERVKEAVEDGKFEMVAMFMPVLAARLEYILRKTLMYQARTNEGAATAITILETVKQGCKLTLTILGGVAGKASGLIGVSLGSAEGAAVATMTQMAAEQL
ncbi:MAG: DUF4157 domain-containing protein [Chitinophagaceae bacterium]|nr:DUF4157 domain-containing protein [Chitinophagaceae bacterium]